MCNEHKLWCLAFLDDSACDTSTAGPWLDLDDDTIWASEAEVEVQVSTSKDLQQTKTVYIGLHCK